MGEREFISVATIHLALEQAGPVVCVYPVAVRDEEDDVAGRISGDVPELVFEVTDSLVSLSAPVALNNKAGGKMCVARYVLRK